MPNGIVKVTPVIGLTTGLRHEMLEAQEHGSTGFPPPSSPPSSPPLLTTSAVAILILSFMAPPRAGPIPLLIPIQYTIEIPIIEALCEIFCQIIPARLFAC